MNTNQTFTHFTTFTQLI